MYEKDISSHQYSLNIKIDRDKICRYSIPLYLIVNKIEEEFDDLICIPSPDKYAEIDIYIDTSQIEIPEEQNSFINDENKETIYIENVVIPNLEKVLICGVPGIKDFFYKKKNNR